MKSSIPGSIGALAVLLLAGLFLLGQQQSSDRYHEPVDITEDYHHRIQGRVFLPSKEPVICKLYHRGANPNESKPARNQFLRVSWEAGSFSIKSDRLGNVVIYMNKDTIFGHVAVAAPKTCDGVSREFPELPVHPILR
jgi:hypothetical protein